MGYIEFDNLCTLSSSKEKFICAELPWLHQCIYHFIGRYNCKEEYMVHRVYMCSTLKSPLVVQEFDQVDGCNNINHILSTSPNFVLKKHDKFQEEEKYWILPTTCPSTKLKPRTVYCQEGEDDEDMTPLDMDIDYKVSLFLHLHNDFL